MPSIPAHASWDTAPLTITLVCEDREASDCQDRVTIHVTAEDAALVKRGRPIGSARAFLDSAMPAQAPGWEFSFPMAPPGRTLRDERRVCCPACLRDIAETYHRPRPPAPVVPDGSVAWWEGCRRFGYVSGLPKGGVALDRGRWIVLTEIEAQRRQNEIDRTSEELGRLLADLLLKSWQRVVDTYCPRCVERLRIEKGTKIDEVPCGNGTCPDLTPAQRTWLAEHAPPRPAQGAPSRRRRKADAPMALDEQSVRTVASSEAPPEPAGTPPDPAAAAPPGGFVRGYPNVAKWVCGHGWIEIGDDLPPLDRPSCIRALDEGGLIWAGEASYPTIDDTLRDLDSAIGRWLREHIGE